MSESWWLRLMFNDGEYFEKYFYKIIENQHEYSSAYIDAVKLGRERRIECERCHRLTPMPFFTRKNLAEAYINVVRTRGGRIIYFCSSKCRRKHRGVLANVGIEFKPSDYFELAGKGDGDA